LLFWFSSAGLSALLRPTRILRARFSDKSLKKWYLLRLAVAAPAFQVPPDTCRVPVKKANSRHACGIAPGNGLPLQTRKAKSPALYGGRSTHLGIAQ
jgi:hypothetical protein